MCSDKFSYKLSIHSFLQGQSFSEGYFTWRPDSNGGRGLGRGEGLVQVEIENVLRNVQLSQQEEVEFQGSVVEMEDGNEKLFQLLTNYIFEYVHRFDTIHSEMEGAWGEGCGT